MTTTEKNRIIAEFMGWKEKEDYLNAGDEKSMFFVTPFNREYWSTGTSMSREGWEQTELFTPEDMIFHSDWRWLMEVVEKIENLGFDTSLDRHEFGKKTTFFIRYGGSNTQSGISKDNKIEAVYNACFEFIQWYNQNKN